jgi:ABC-type sugar transport system substrate-binding protein
MKKAFALFMAVLLLLAPAACGEATNTAGSSAAAGSASAAPSSSPSVGRADEVEIVTNSAEAYATDKGTVGFYTDKVDYFVRPAYKIVFMNTMNSLMGSNFIQAFTSWGKRLNYELTPYCSNGDIDGYVNTIDVYAQQGFDGFIFDISTEYQARVLEVANELKLNWMPGMTPFRDEDKKLTHPDIVFDTWSLGQQMGEWLVKDAQKRWADFSEQNGGFIGVTYSDIFEFRDELNGAVDWVKTNGFPVLAGDHYYLADCITGQINAQTAFDKVAAIISAHPEIKYWLICANCDDFGEGASRAADAVEKTDSTTVIVDGGETLFAQWDSGYNGCWRAADYVAQMIYVEGKACGLVALIDGRATPETLWQNQVETGGRYGCIKVPTVIVTKDNYTEYLEWVDNYTGTNTYNYEWKGTSFEEQMQMGR